MLVGSGSPAASFKLKSVSLPIAVIENLNANSASEMGASRSTTIKSKSTSKPEIVSWPHGRAPVALDTSNTSLLAPLVSWSLP